jgi:hypothetical protein
MERRNGVEELTKLDDFLSAVPRALLMSKRSSIGIRISRWKNNWRKRAGNFIRIHLRVGENSERKSCSGE